MIEGDCIPLGADVQLAPELYTTQPTLDYINLIVERQDPELRFALFYNVRGDGVHHDYVVAFHDGRATGVAPSTDKAFTAFRCLHPCYQEKVGDALVKFINAKIDGKKHEHIHSFAKR